MSFAQLVGLRSLLVVFMAFVIEECNVPEDHELVVATNTTLAFVTSVAQNEGIITSVGPDPAR